MGVWDVVGEDMVGVGKTDAGAVEPVSIVGSCLAGSPVRGEGVHQGYMGWSCNRYIHGMQSEWMYHLRDSYNIKHLEKKVGYEG